jgi:hypothetical protein
VPNGTGPTITNDTISSSRQEGPTPSALRPLALLHAAMLITVTASPAGAQPAASPSTEPTADLAAMTPQQDEALRAAIAARRADRQTGRDVTEASLLIERVVRTSACGRRNGDWAALNRDAVQALVEPLFAPLKTDVARFNDTYHDDRHCYDVVRLAEVGKPAANALRFSAYMISPDSGRATTRSFELVRVDGRWLIRSLS